MLKENETLFIEDKKMYDEVERILTLNNQLLSKTNPFYKGFFNSDYLHFSREKYYLSSKYEFCQEVTFDEFKSRFDRHHSFCETPNSQCTANYCDENGCMDRKRVLVEPVDLGVREFVDRFGADCSIHEGSLAFENTIWLGVNKANPLILATQAEKYGIITDQTTGWVPYPVPKDVLLSTRMLLTQDMVKRLLPTLNHFVETGELL